MENQQKTFYIKVTPDGPYLVYGNPPLDQEIIVPNEDGHPWVYKKGKHFSTGTSEKGEFGKHSSAPYALCRCGSSKHAPFCDGTHKKVDWNPTETAGFKLYNDEAELIKGPVVTLEDEEDLCAYARFCDAYGTVWRLVKEELDKKGEEIFAHEVKHCPSGRLVGWNTKTGEKYEPEFEPSIGLIEDPQLAISGPIWVKGGIRIESADGKSYEIRNRVTLCRCGNSSNKPFCDGTHASCEYNDGLSYIKDNE